MEVDGENPEDITMQDGEGEEQQQRTPFHTESALAQQTSMQQQEVLSDTGVIERRKCMNNSNIGKRLQKTQMPSSKRSKGWNKPDKETIVRLQEHWEKQGQEQRASAAATCTGRKLEEEQVKAQQQQQKLVRDVSMLENQEQEQEVLRERLASDAITLKEQELEQEHRKQKLSFGAIAVREDERQQEKMHQKLIGCASTLREQEEKQEEQLQLLVTEEKELLNRKQKQEDPQKSLATEASQLVFQEQKQKERRENLAAVAGELVVQWEKVHQRKLAEYESDLEKQELMQNEELERLMANTSELRKQEKRQKSMESKVLGIELDEPETFQEQDERDTGELQRRGQEELVEPELLSPSKPDCGRIDAGPSTTVLPAQQCSTEAVQKGVTATSDSAPKDISSSAQERGRQHGESQANGQDGNLRKENCEPEAQERGQEHEEQEWNEYRMEDSGQEERVHEGEVLDAEYNDTAGGDK
ncbi:hypothetical protein N7G274_005311 [Stereocaulon virgatum]|uniref:Trichohyalin-like n=1 Tax=Stereocaulon virgatum TaxID=373712 RepID=A0ABR4AAP4_9LECA